MAFLPIVGSGKYARFEARAKPQRSKFSFRETIFPLLFVFAALLT
ncbi:MAG TPA: hypothetical protein VFI23_06185 [Rhizomicrobium sp.]|nr:hypothetical protein [Rhizomicrobium sp.]